VTSVMIHRCKVYLYKIANKIINLKTPDIFRGGVVSLTFDDQWHSAYSNAIPLLESYGFKSTWYICVGNVGNYDDEYKERCMNWDEIGVLGKLDHEIASHTITHCDFDIEGIDKIREELKNSKSILTSRLKCSINNFSYPFTRTGSIVGGPQAAIENYKSARGGEFGLNSFPLRRDNLFACKLYEKEHTIDYFKALVDICAVEHKWLIIYTHDVKENFSKYGCSPAFFETMVKYLHDKKIQVDTVSKVVQQSIIG
jgi:peptidoglycan/xylan/chitin deacetylase (PgdA/CDA1 family)